MLFSLQKMLGFTSNVLGYYKILSIMKVVLMFAIITKFTVFTLGHLQKRHILNKIKP